MREDDDDAKLFEAVAKLWVYVDDEVIDELGEKGFSGFSE